MTLRTIDSDRLIDGEKLKVIKLNGLGDKYLSDDGTYKIVSSGDITNTDDLPEGAINKYDKIVSLLAGAGITVSGTYPNFTVTNSSPDQIVNLTAGTNVTITGTYPNFTINSTGGSGGGDMLKAVYDQEGGNKQVAFKDNVDKKINTLTGVNNQIELTQGTGNTFSITNGSGYINYGGNITTVTWTGKTNITDQYPGSDVTFIFINNLGNVVQIAGTHTPQDFRQYIMIGAIGKDINGNIVFFRTISSPNYDSNTFMDLLDMIGIIQDGKIKIGGNSNLSLNLTGGTLFSVGSNQFNSIYGPNFTPISSIGVKPFKMVYRNAGGDWIIGPEQTLLNTALYDNGTGTLANTGANKFTNMIVYISSTGYMYIQYGQVVYNNLSNAIAGVNSEVRSDWTYGANEIVKLAYISIKSGTTATNNTSDCLVTNLGKFGVGGGGSGGGTSEHNLLTGIQGGATGDYQHLTTAQLTNLNNQSGTNTGDNAPNSLYSGLATSKQDTLVSGTNIKTVNGNSLLGSGDIVISGGGGSQSEPIADYQGQAYVGVLGEYTFTSAKTLTRCSINVSSIPVGSNCILELRYQTSTGTNLLSSTLQVTTSDTLTNGHKLVSVTGFTDTTMDAGDTVVAFLTSVGTTTPALNPVCYLDFN